jgi:hypothetical protein
MTAAQKKARANFSKAIAYRKKTGCTLKEAFAQVRGGTVKGLDKVVKKGNKTIVLYSKKAAPPKKVGAKKTVYITGGNKTFIGKKGIVLNSNYNGAIIVKVGTKKVVVQNGDYSFTKPKNKVVKQGKLFGVGAISLKTLADEFNSLDYKIYQLKQQKKDAKTIAENKNIQEKISILNKQFQALKVYFNTVEKFR